MSPSPVHARRLMSPPVLFGVFAVLSLWLLSWAISRSSLLLRDQELVASAILFDLTVTAPFAFWLCACRFGEVPAWTPIPIAAAGLALSHWLLPFLPPQAMALALAAAACLELGALALAVSRLRQLSQRFRLNKANGLQTFDAVEAAFAATPPFKAVFAHWLRVELEFWFLLVAGWFLHPKQSQFHFSHHREPGWSAIAMVLGLLVIVETVVLHVGLATYDYKALSLVSLLIHLYSLVWLIGDFHALRLYPSAIKPNASIPLLHVRVGLRFEAQIPLASIASVQRGDFTLPEQKPSAAVLGTPNIKLTFTHPATLKRLFRADTDTRDLYLQVDEAEAFIKTLRPLLSTNCNQGNATA